MTFFEAPDDVLDRHRLVQDVEPDTVEVDVGVTHRYVHFTVRFLRVAKVSPRTNLGTELQFFRVLSESLGVHWRVALGKCGYSRSQTDMT